MRKLVEKGEEGPVIFESLEVEDIRRAADLFRPKYEATEGRDGFVSIEVAPTLARETQATIVEARRLWREVNRPNVLVKVPGTAEGLPAIEQLLGEGININITLLFAIERYEQVAYAYLAALEKLAGDGKPLDRIASVASFFVSRIDTLADQQLEARLSCRLERRRETENLESAGQDSQCQRQAGLREVQGDLFQFAVQSPGREGGARTAYAVGFHGHQEPQVQRCDLRGTADRPRHH